MKEAFDLIRKRIEEITELIRPVGWSRKIEVVETKAVMDILSEVEAEYGNGWIPCSERLPEPHLTYDIFKRPDRFITEPVLVTVKSVECDGEKYYVGMDIMTGSTKEDMRWLMSCGYGGSAVYNQEIIAWKPLPEPYKPEKGTKDGKIQ